MTQERKPKFKIGDEIFYSSVFSGENFFALEKSIIKGILKKTKSRTRILYIVKPPHGFSKEEHELFTKEEAQEKFKEWLGEGA